MKLTFKQTAFAALASVALVLGVGSAFFPGFNSNLVVSRATTTSQGMITFNGSDATRSGTTNTVVAHTDTGGTIICKTFDNDSTQSSGYVGALKAGSTIRFYEADGETEYTFEDLDIIRFYYGGYCGYDINYVYSDGRTGQFSYSDSTGSSGRGANFSDKTKYGDVSNISVECKTAFSRVATLSKIEITYNCTPKAQTGISVSTAPTKTNYSVGESFDPTGMIVTADYSNGTHVATTSYTYYPSGSLTSSDEYITISHNGFSTTQAINVSVPTGFSGSYVSSSWTLVFTSSTQGYYEYMGYTLYFSYAINDPSITFTYISGDNTNFGNGMLFKSGETTNATGSITGNATFSLKTYSNWGTATTRTFTKSSFDGEYDNGQFHFSLYEDGSGYYIYGENNYIEFVWIENGGKIKFSFDESSIADEMLEKYMPYRNESMVFVQNVEASISDSSFTCTFYRDYVGSKSISKTFTKS